MPGRILFVSRDTGSVQAIAPVACALANEPTVLCHTVSLAVSRRVLDEHGIEHEPLDELAFAGDPAACIGRLLERHRPDVVVSGSSPARGQAPETPEQHMLLEARRRGIATLGVLDTWLLHRERFAFDAGAGRADAALLPDVLCVPDRPCAEQLRNLGVPAQSLRITHNPWLDAVHRGVQVPAARSAELGTGLNVLFVSQPLAQLQSVRHWPFTQYELFDTLVAALPPASAAAPHRVLVWVHPSETGERWRSGMPGHRADVEVRIGVQRGAAVLAHIDLLVSSHSTVAYEALHHATPCVSLRPNGKALASLVSDELGLSTVFHDAAAFAEYLRAGGHAARRAELRERREALAARQVFFTDGQATARVVREVLNLLAARYGAPATGKEDR